MSQQDIRIEALGADRVADGLRLSQAARWPHRREDWELLLRFSKGWAAIDDAGQTVGTAVFTPFGTTGGAINMVIVDAAMRGRGLGRRLFSTTLEAGQGRRMRLTATPDGEPLYRSLGFKPFGHIFQRQGFVTSVPSPGSIVVQAALAEDEAAVADLDAAAFGEDRRDLIRALWQEGDFVLIRLDGAVSGFACVRSFGRGSLIGPVVAQTTEQAAALIGHLAADLSGKFVRIDITADSGLETLLDGMGLPQVDDGLVMWTAAPASPPPGAARTMALASQALG